MCLPLSLIFYIVHDLLVGEVNRRKYLAQARLPRRGYVTRPSGVGQSASEKSHWAETWANVTPSEQQHTLQPTAPVRMYIAVSDLY